ncbi:CTP synthetase [Roseovarius sp. 2305UL8-3]|uniref:CTP synthetase n=1 Tax=Roseovarius conchicola TaxID=3121636 RepID=UPI003528E10E
MFRLALILHLFIGSTLAGSAVIATLVAGQDTVQMIIIAALVGFLAAFPISWMVAKKLYEEG